MLFDRLEFFVGQWSGFEKNLVGDSELANVVKGSGFANHPDKAGWEAELCCEFCRARADALRVVKGVVVAVFRCACEFLKCLGSRAPQFARAFPDRVLERVSGSESPADVVVHGTEAGQRTVVDDRRDGHRDLEPPAVSVEALGVALGDRVPARRRYEQPSLLRDGVGWT